MDTAWFTRLEGEDAGSSMYDKQAGTMLAIARFEKYVQEELIVPGKLEPKKENSV